MLTTAVVIVFVVAQGVTGYRKGCTPEQVAGPTVIGIAGLLVGAFIQHVP